MSEKNSSPEISPKRTQGEIEVSDTKKFMSSPEMNIADPGMVKILIFVFMLKINLQRLLYISAVEDKRCMAG